LIPTVFHNVYFNSVASADVHDQGPNQVKVGIDD